MRRQDDIFAVDDFEFFRRGLTHFLGDSSKRIGPLAAGFRAGAAFDTDVAADGVEGLGGYLCKGAVVVAYKSTIGDTRTRLSLSVFDVPGLQSSFRRSPLS